ncbi:MAG: GNAT family N-acetyltransferase [Planctomycetes bacterium]|nr:GNAT family N-acetyltransferase [Planctomycetota bacterium]
MEGDTGPAEIAIREATGADLDGIVDVYRKCFPASGRVRLGRRTSSKYFQGLVAHSSYRLYVAEGRRVIAGFAVLVVASGPLLSRTRLLGSPGVWLEMVRFGVRHPGAAFGHLLGVARALLQRGGPGKAVRCEAAERFSRMKAAWLEILGVNPSWRRRGVAASLIAHISGVAAEMGCGCVKLNVDRDNAGAIGCYEKQGFVRTVESPTEYTYARECP